MSYSDPLPYIKRVRDYYLALGFDTPYRWATFEHVPFTPLRVPLEKATVSIVTTAAPFAPEKGDQAPGAPYNGAAKFFSVYSMPTDERPDLRISHIAIDRDHTTAKDLGTYFPLQAMQSLVAEGVIASVGSRFHGLPTNRSHRTTMEVDARELVRRCAEDQVNGVVLVPNCPVCHQSVSLAARALEAEGIPTVIMGCAKDIVEHVGVPRMLFNDFPLGNAAGLPHDPASQRAIVQQALELLRDATAPRTTVKSPFSWSGAADWKKDYSNPALLSAEELRERRKAFDAAKATVPPK